VDYIDKPVNPTELDNAIKKAFKITKKILKEPDTSASVNKRFCLLTDIDKRFVEADEILYFQSSKRYSQVHFVDGNKRIVRYSLVHLKKNLPSGHFIHVSRQFIINIKYLKKISKSNKNITLQYCNTEIKLGKIFPVVLTELIKKYSLKV